MFQDLVDKKLVHAKKLPNGLNIFKYHKKVFYENLWNKDKRLLDARGIILDNSNNIVQMPFTKVFNFGENGVLVDRDREVLAIRKVNGFLGVATWHEDQLLISTTGSVDSDFAALARKWLDKPGLRRLFKANPSKSFMFEIADEADPHIVFEEPGAYLIGAREKRIGSALESEENLDAIADLDDLCEEVHRPESIRGTFDKIRQILKTVQHEGFMIRDVQSGETLCKLKSPYYLSKKALMRVGSAKVEFLFSEPEKFKERLDEEFYGIVDYLTKSFTAESWRNLDEQGRRNVIEQFFKE